MRGIIQWKRPREIYLILSWSKNAGCPCNAKRPRSSGAVRVTRLRRTHQRVLIPGLARFRSGSASATLFSPVPRGTIRTSKGLHTQFPGDWPRRSVLQNGMGARISGVSISYAPIASHISFERLCGFFRARGSECSGSDSGPDL